MAMPNMARMRAKEQGLSAERLRALVHYNSETGIFSSRITIGRCDRWKAGRQIGCLMKNGYRIVRIENQLFLEHRLAFLYTEGCWPTDYVDHVNGKRSDNRWANLRHASRNENAQNSSIKKHNSTGFKGVIPSKGGYAARIMVDRKVHKLGNFDSPKKAHEAYARASRELHGQFSNTGSA